MKSRQSTSWLLTVLLSIVLCGCQKGCTTSKTIDKESKTIKVGDLEGTITVRHIQYKHIKSKKGGIKTSLDKSVKYSYAIVWDVDFPFWEQKDVAYEGTDDNADLKEQLDRFNFKVSKDQKHFSYGIGDQLMGVMHIYNGLAFEDPDKIGVEYDVVSFEKVSIEGYEDPEEIIANILDKGEICTSGDINNEYTIIEILNSLPDDHQLRKIAFESWPQCNIAKKVFTPKKLKTMIKALPEYRDIITSRIESVITDDKSGIFDKKEVLKAVIDLNDKEILYKVDKVLVDHWAVFMAREINDYITQRTLDKKTPMQPETIELYVQKCMHGLNNLIAGNRDLKIDNVERLKFLALNNRTKEIDYFIKNTFGARTLDRNLIALDKVITKNWELLNDKQRNKILKQYQNNFKSIKSYNHAQVYKFLKKHLDCKDLIKIKESYPENLDDERLPLKCNEGV